MLSSTLSQFLKNSLSGAREDPSIASEAILIPLGKRTNLAKARTQLNGLFDRAEKAIAPLPANTEVEKARTARIYKDVQKKSERKLFEATRTFKRDAEGFAGTLGLLLGLTAQAVPAAMGAVSDAGMKAITALREAGNSVASKASAFATWASDTYKNAKAGVKGAWDSMLKGVDSVVEGAKETLLSMGHKSFEFIEGIFAVPKKDVAPTFEFPKQAHTHVAEAIQSFMTSMRNTIRNWLWSPWGGVSDGDGGASGAGSAGSAGGIDGGGGVGGGARLQKAATRGRSGIDVGKMQPYGPGGGGKVSGSDRERALHLMDRLIKVHGFTPEAAAIAAGNAEQENGFNSGTPNDLGGDGGMSHGLFQWNRERFTALKAYAASVGKNWYDFDTQVDFFAQEIQQRSRMEREWKNAKDLSMARPISKAFEGYRIEGKRVPNAYKWLKEYIDHPPDAQPATVTPNTPAPSSGGMAPSANNGTVVIGDSLGVGIQNALGTPGDAVVGRSPAKVLAAIQAYKGDLRGKRVVLSSGLSNNPSQVGMLGAQIEALKLLGAAPENIVVLGVGDRTDLNGLNPLIKKTVEGAGAHFIPIDPNILSPDRVHPKNYKGIAGQAVAPFDESPVQAPSEKRIQMPAPTPPAEPRPIPSVDYEDHGWHRKKAPQVVQSDGGLILVTHEAYA